jgi:hypothetical protein
MATPLEQSVIMGLVIEDERVAASGKFGTVELAKRAKHIHWRILDELRASFGTILHVRNALHLVDNALLVLFPEYQNARILKVVKTTKLSSSLNFLVI